jgi:putative ABC transport system permease protein
MSPILCLKSHISYLTSMLRNYFKTAWRNLLKNKTHGVINISGLAVGLAGFLVILLYLNHELSYDTWSEELKRVYKISERTDDDILEQSPAPLAEFLKSNAAAVESATRISPAGTYEVLLSVGDKKIYQPGSIEVDSSFFKVFPYRMLSGDAATALDQPNAMVISQAVAEKLFGDEDPIGKTIRVYNAVDCVVTAVMQEPETPSHLEAEVVYRSPYENRNTFWQNYSYQTYVKTHVELPVAELEQVLDRLYYDQRLKEGNLSFQNFRAEGHLAGLFVDAVQDLHNFPKYSSSDFPTVSVLLLLAILLLVQGTINFSNLSLAGSIRRAKEVGVRKVLGSNRGQLLWQFMGETFIQCLIALAIALLLVNLILPAFNSEFGIGLNLLQSSGLPSLILQVAVCLVMIVALSGLYPAVFLSRYNASQVLKGNHPKGTRGASLRNALIVVQFTVSAFFIIGTLVISRQMEYMQMRDKGFSGEQVMRLEATQQIRDAKFEAVSHTLLNIPGVQYVSKTTNVPGDVFVDTTTVTFNHAGNGYRMASVKVSTDYFKTLDIDLVQGRLFDQSYTDQHTKNAIVNETAARKLSLDEPLEATVTFPYCDSIPVQIVGVVKDFNVSGFENNIQPVVYTIGNEACMWQSGGALLLKLEGNSLQQTIAAVEQAWTAIDPDFPIRYSFLDENFEKLFASYVRLQKVINFFSFTAIAIAAMGLFSLTAFLIGQRTKEIGIRKVLGAEVHDLSLLLGKDFIRLILIAVVIAIPLGWWAASRWLEGFAYRIELDVWTFLVAAMALIGIAMLTVGIQTTKAALANPVKSLRSE